MASSSLRFLDQTQRRTPFGRTPLDEWSARRRDFYLTTHSTHKRQASMPGRDSNPQSQQASGRRPTPVTARPLGSANVKMYRTKILFLVFNCVTFGFRHWEKYPGRRCSIIMFRKIFGRQGKEVRSGWWKSHKAELPVLFPSPNTARIVKSKNVRCMGHV
jgi:hypothetical protein